MQDKLAIHARDGKVYINFPQPVTNVEFDIATALQVAEGLINRSRQALQQQKPLIVIPKVN